MVEVSILFVILDNQNIVNCSSLYLIDKGKKYTILTEKVLKCQNFEIKIDEMIASSPFNVKRVLYTFGMSAIAILDSNKPFNRLSTLNNWGVFTMDNVIDYVDTVDYHHILNFIDILKTHRFFESQRELVYNV
jgi:hypothetical protein